MWTLDSTAARARYLVPSAVCTPVHRPPSTTRSVTWAPRTMTEPAASIIAASA
jgi:hypothetical protein